MKILGYAMIAVGVGIMTFNGKPRHWEKGAYLKHILIDVGGVLVALAGLWLLDQ